MKRKLSEGARRLAEHMRRHGGRPMARRLDVDEATLRAAAKGRACPRIALRQNLHEQYGISLDAWETAVRRNPPARASSAPATSMRKRDWSLEPFDIRRETQEAMEYAEREYRRVEADPHASSRERVEAICARARATITWAKANDSKEVTVAKILRSTHWRRVYVIMRDVLVSRYPGAIEAVDRGLAELVQEESQQASGRQAL